MIAADIDPHFPPRPTALAQEILRPMINRGDFVIDATTGNGHDTVFLADCVGETGRVLALDIQEAALVSARARVDEAGFSGRVEFRRASHVELEAFVSVESVAAVMFNLGYLPGENHEVTTKSAETLSALDAATRILRPGGVLSVVCYPGHLEGAAEAEKVEAWFADRAGQGWRIAKYGAIGTRRPAPFLLLASKIS